MDNSKREKEQGHVEHLGGRVKNPNVPIQSKGPVDPNETIEVTLVVRRPHSNSEKLIQMDRTSFKNVFGAKEEDLKRIRAFAAAHHLNETAVHPEAGTMKLSGKVADLNQAFKIDLEHFEHPDYEFRSHRDEVSLPEPLNEIVKVVLGLDNRPQLTPHFHILEEGEIRAVASSQNQPQPFNPNEVASLYNFPQASNLSEQCIGIIELGGGYNEKDLSDYFGSLGLPTPTVTSVSVDGATNTPTGNPNSADGEVVLDIEVAGAVAPGVNIVVYFAPNTDAGFLNAINTAIHDKNNNPSVLSISWGSAEANWTKQAMDAMDQAFQDAAKLGVTVTSAAGDQGSSDGASDGRVHVDFPASSPHVLACGGTELFASNGQITREVVWDESRSSATGGGVSEVFPLPDWQKGFNIPVNANPGGTTGRGVPDVAGDADPTTGYKVLVDGKMMIVGGTSAVAPLWAGLIAILNQKLGQDVGFLNPIIYNQHVEQSAFHDIINGTNDTSWLPNAYRANQGWDACTGLGTPNGQKLLEQIQMALNAHS